MYPSLLGRVWPAVLLHKLNSYGISGQFFGLISFFLDDVGLLVALNGKSSKEYPVNAEVPKGSFVVLHFSYVLSSWDYYQLFHFSHPRQPYSALPVY